VSERNGVLLRVEDLTPSERLILARRRMGFNQQEMAALLGIAPFTYGRMERGEVPLDYDKIDQHKLPLEEALSPSEKAHFYRLRSDPTVGQSKIAEDLGVSRIWVNRMERGLVSADRLVQYWER
jgi:DNA-binding XRE family transcriptional regulator